MVFFGGLMLIPGWSLYFFPLMAFGTWLRGMWHRRSAPSVIVGANTLAA